jgi:hypothetical protein
MDIEERFACLFTCITFITFITCLHRTCICLISRWSIH